MQISYTYKNLCLCILVFNLLSCAKAEIRYPAEASADGYIVIEPACEALLPAHTYHFYRIDDLLHHITLACDGQGNFRGTLPVGTYHVLATNPAVQGADFRGLDSHRTAMAHATNLSSFPISRTQQLPVTRPLTIDNRLDYIYSSVIEELTITAGDTIHRTPEAVQLTRTVTLNFILKGKLPELLSTLKGTLQGVYPSVHLFDQCTTEAEIARSPDVTMTFAAQPESGTGSYSNKWQSTLHLFGICNPEYGEAYQNILHITLDIAGEIETLSIDLSDELSRLIEKNNGVIPLELPLNFEIQWDGVELTSGIKPWQDGGTGEGDV